MKSVITFSHLLQKEGGTGVNPITEIAGKKFAEWFVKPTFMDQFKNNMITINVTRQ